MIRTVRGLASKSIVFLRMLGKEARGLLYFPVSALPGAVGWNFRCFFLRGSVALGKNVMIDEFVRIDHPKNLVIGDNTFIGRGCFINAAGNVIIGSNILIGPGVKIWSADHRFSSREIPICNQGHILSPVVIEDDVWIGVDSVILKGVTIGKGAVVAAGSVVTKNVAAFQIVAGVPASVNGVR